MNTRQVIESFWAAMRANDWTAAADHLVPDCVVDWPLSRERFVGREAFAALQSGYPSATGRWTFDIRHVVVDGDTAVSHVAVSDGDQSAVVIAFAAVRDGQITSLVEYWPTDYEPAGYRASLREPG